MQPDWQTPAGRLLLTFSEAIRQRHLSLERPILVFGSAPLQIYFDPAFLSADVDIASAGYKDILKKLVEELGLSKGQAVLYIEVVGEHVFRPGPGWRERAEIKVLNGVTFLFPHPTDILVAKLYRLDAKDLRAFEVILQKTGHPTAEELILELRDCFEKFRPELSGSKSEFWKNVERLWPAIYKHPIDVSSAILGPVIAELEEAGYSPDYLEIFKAKLGNSKNSTSQ